MVTTSTYIDVHDDMYTCMCTLFPLKLVYADLHVHVHVHVPIVCTCAFAAGCTLDALERATKTKQTIVDQGPPLGIDEV